MGSDRYEVLSGGNSAPASVGVRWYLKNRSRSIAEAGTTDRDCGENMATSKRALAKRLFRRASKKASERFMSRIGGGLVSGMADTSADAPSGGFQPKRNRYAEMQAEKAAARDAARASQPAPASEASPPEAAHDHGHSHEHGHSHGHDHDHGH